MTQRKQSRRRVEEAVLETPENKAQNKITRALCRAKSHFLTICALVDLKLGARVRVRTAQIILIPVVLLSLGMTRA